MSKGFWDYLSHWQKVFPAAAPSTGVKAGCKMAIAAIAAIAAARRIPTSFFPWACCPSSCAPVLPTTFICSTGIRPLWTGGLPLVHKSGLPSAPARTACGLRAFSFCAERGGDVPLSDLPGVALCAAGAHGGTGTRSSGLAGKIQPARTGAYRPESARRGTHRPLHQAAHPCVQSHGLDLRQWGVLPARTDCG